jgi:hypothetical protein
MQRFCSVTASLSCRSWHVPAPQQGSSTTHKRSLHTHPGSRVSCLSCRRRWPRAAAAAPAGRAGPSVSGCCRHAADMRTPRARRDGRSQPPTVSCVCARCASVPCRRAHFEQLHAATSTSQQALVVHCESRDAELVLLPVKGEAGARRRRSRAGTACAGAHDVQPVQDFFQRTLVGQPRLTATMRDACVL